MNNDIKETHKRLINDVLELSKKLDTVTDAKDAELINNEIQEINHRVNLLQRMLFIRVSDDIANKSKAVSVADDKLKEIIKQVEKITEIVRYVSLLLAQVDELIDLAKTYL